MDANCGPDPWIIPAWSLINKELFRIELMDRPRVGGFNSWIVTTWSLKNKKLFRIGLVDRPRVEPYNQGVVPYWTSGSSTRGRCLTHGSSPRRALKTGRCSKLEPNIWSSFLTQCYYPHTSRESVSPVCGIFVYEI